MTPLPLLIGAFAAVMAAETGPVFEVASVRPHSGAAVQFGGLEVSGPRVRLNEYTIFGLVMEAYGVRDYQLEFRTTAPKDDIYDTLYDIVARAPADRTPGADELRAMLRNLLAERFGLKVHRESREMPVYALLQGKKGQRLKESSAESSCSVREKLASDGRNDEDTFTGCPIDRLVHKLGKIGDRTVIDRTGLTGNYDFRLVAIPEYRTRSKSDIADIAPLTAVEELGLKLVPQRAQIEIVVVDQIEKPGEN